MAWVFILSVHGLVLIDGVFMLSVHGLVSMARVFFMSVHKLDPVGDITRVYIKELVCY